MSKQLTINKGICEQAKFVSSPNFDERPLDSVPETIIIHSISLPPGDYTTNSVEEFFSNRLKPEEHDYFEGICHLQVSAHFFIRRTGKIIQFVNANERAWHAGVSECLGKTCVNDFSIGIEMEGWDEADDGFTELQYQTLLELSESLSATYEIPVSHYFRHSDIAPDRKNDPGPYFKWDYFIETLSSKVSCQLIKWYFIISSIDN